ncbi:MAG: hypothetical protein ABII00_16730 [Elusimicrobiota bacterium]
MPEQGIRPGTERISAALYSALAAFRQALDRTEPLRAANAVLAILTAFSLGYLILLWTHDDQQASPREGPEGGLAPEQSRLSRRRYPYYIKAVRSRDLFGRRRRVVVEKKRTGPTAAQRARRLRLMGFIEADGALQAVVLDRRARVTRYVRKGDTIRGLLVETVGGGKVVLTKDGDKVTLSL